MRKILLSIAFSFVVINAQAANTNSKTLDNLKSKINDMQTYLDTQQTKRHSYEQQLKQSEIKSTELTSQLKKTTTDLKQKTADLKKLEEHSKGYQEQFEIHQALLEQQLKAGYVLTQGSYLKLLLSQQDPDTINRNLKYYNTIQQSRLQSMEALKALLNDIKTNQQQIKFENQQLANLKMQQQQEKFKLSIIQQDRRQAILSLNKEIKTKNQKLQALLADKHQLEKALVNLNQHSPQFIVSDGKSFAQLQHQLPWPTQGRIIQAYGSPIEQSELRTTSVLIAAPFAQSVQAVAPGKVIFAKWMAGYGLLIIIDHGNHYLSLYGRNHSLLKQEGELVKAG
ncbi:MAG TPA: peptidoglycan DD-metalloendopeptidase family protein, partial [Coxiellaceae bacterium]|nr:peptidoglycan DD-metalloendopeptidase family protein [Coxiellaceae bacterium]